MMCRMCDEFIKRGLFIISVFLFMENVDDELMTFNQIS